MGQNNKTAFLGELKAHYDKEKAEHHIGFFKAFKGGYGEGDIFWGMSVPVLRKISADYRKKLSLAEIEELLQHKVHEVRQSALRMMVEVYKKADEKTKRTIVSAYLRNTKHINNWDLVDISAPYITGEYWFNNGTKGMWKLARSGKLWEERISMLSTLYFIRNGRFGETLELAEFFLGHKHDLMHKASGWMLREAGKRDPDVLRGFLDKHHKGMPRTMLRYSLEKLSDKERKKYMEK